MALERVIKSIKSRAQELTHKINEEDGMLVLTRKIDQGIVISGNIYVRVLGVERDRVKIGISAPLEITVLRQELLEREKQQSADQPAALLEEDAQADEA